MIKGNWSEESAFNLELALSEARDWIERVVGQKFPSDDFQASLKDGVFLCKLINTIKPGAVAKINTQSTDFAKRENCQHFIKAAKSLGLKDTQLFDTSDLYESKRIRNVAISLYWLGRAARAISTYKGPQLNLLAFKKMHCSACKKPITDNNYLATLTQQWHTSCAKCHNCNCQLDPKKQFFMEGSNPWCSDCMVGATNLGGSKGGAGSKKPKHDHSNECSSCYGSLEKGYVPEGDQKYCTNCICDLCHEPLIGNFNVVGGKKICDSCTCSSCSKPLSDGFFEEGIAKYCEPCAKKSLNEKNASKTQSPKDHHHHHPDQAHSHAPKSTTSTTTSPSQSNKCKACPTPIDKKPKKHNDRDKYCQPHEKEYCCGGCDKEIEGSAIQSPDGENFHPSCFKCNKCSKTLGPKDTIKKSPTNGKPLCGPCASSSSSPKQSSVHCTKCKKPANNDYYDVNGSPYCPPCYDTLPKGGSGKQGYGPNDKCNSCNLSLHGDVTTVEDVYYHKGCFHCQSCKASLISGYYAHDKKPYCKPCSDKIQSASSSKCGKCSKAIIEGAYVKVNDTQFHKQCFTCNTCSKALQDGSTFTKFSKPYCKDCFTASNQKLSCCKCRTPITEEYHESSDKIYCKKCAPSTNTTIWTHRVSYGWTIDPRSGKKTARDPNFK